MKIKTMMAALAGMVLAAGAADFDVRDYGAKADGATDNTAAFARAISAANAAGGGRVVVPAAEKPYVSYTISLKSNVDFHIEEGAVVKGGPDGMKYEEFAPTPLWGWNRTPRFDKRAFFYTLAATNVAITGKGRIDGSSEAFYRWNDRHGAYWRDSETNLPGRCVFFVRCRDVNLEDFTIVHTTGWNTWFLGCDRLNIRRVSTETDRRIPNGDGLHISSCRDVLVEDCHIDSSDDSFAIRSHQELLPPELAACERITVRNTFCRSSGASFCRFGWSTDYAVRDVLFDNVVCSNCWTGVSVHLPNLLATYPEPPRGHGLEPLPLEKCKPFELERIRFRNCDVTCETHPIQMVCGNALKTRPVKFIRNIAFETVDFHCSKPPEFVVWAENNVSDIRLKDVTFDIRKSAHEKIIGSDSLFFDNVRDVVLENVRWTSGGASVAIDAPLPDDYKFPASMALRTDAWIGEGMVFQRDRTFKVTGDAKPGTKVTVTLGGRKNARTADDDGRWSVPVGIFAAGGPFTMTVESDAGEKLVYKDVYAGDVWMCSGQSNMEMPVWGDGPHYRLPDGKQVAAAAHDPMIRLLKVPRRVSIRPETRFAKGEEPRWQGATTPEAVEPFSAVGYFFGRELRKRHPEVPVGLVGASWGGSYIEPWIPEGALARAGYTNEINRLAAVRRDDLEGDAASGKDPAAFKAWIAAFDAACATNAMYGAWKDGDQSTFPTLTQPGAAEYRFFFDVKPDETKHGFVFHLDCVDDADVTFCDGREIGATTPSRGHTNTWDAKRDYAFTVDRAGRHEIVVRAFSHRNGLYLSPKIWLDDRTTGRRTSFTEAPWQERILFKVDDKVLGKCPLPPEVDNDPAKDNTLPSSLFNGMIAPFKDMPLAGTIWFQGCANGREPERYAGFGRTLAGAWRDYFATPEMPFLVAQIGAFKRETPRARMSDDFWKEMKPDDTGFSFMREAQYEYGTEPHCGIACAIDIGDHSNIHFPNKKEVGRRLAHEAFRVAYGEEGFEEGPCFGSAARDGSAVIVTIAHAGKGLKVDGDGVISPRVFSLAGTNGVLHWATATLVGKDAFRVSSDAVPDPVEVRYAFTGYAGGNLARRAEDGLPVFPFRRAVVDRAIEGEIAYGPFAKNRLDIYVSKGARETDRLPATLVWFHGGGLAAGDKADCPKEILDEGIPLLLVSANYRFLAEGGADAPLDDAARAVAWVLDHIADYGGDPSKVFVAGHSAGGYLTYMVGFDPSLLKKYGHANTELKGLIPLSGQVTDHFGIRMNALGDKDSIYQPKIGRYSPFSYLSNPLPPVSVIVGDRHLDWACRTVENELMVASLRETGHRDCEFYELKGKNHGTCRAGFASIAANFIILHENAPREVSLAVDFAKGVGPMRAVNGVGQPPILGWCDDAMFHYLPEANIKYSRLHDTGGVYGGNRFVDIPNVFRDFDADENDPKSYDFAFTDKLLLAMHKHGLEPIYRLGVTIENEWFVRSLRLAAPKDPAKWARICEHVIAHYNEGWADGYKLGVKYWEIWNEAEPWVPKKGITPKPGQAWSAMWDGTPEQYYELYDVTAKHLKKRFGDAIRIGGPAATGAFGSPFKETETHWDARMARQIKDWNRNFLKYAKAHGSPLDFYSWHCYRPVDGMVKAWGEVKAMLRECGFENVPTHLNEWNNVNMSSEYGTLVQAAHATAMLVALQTATDVDIACYYDAGLGVIGPKVNYKGLFTPYCQPTATYWAFGVFGSLTALGEQVEATFEGGRPQGVWACAARGKDGKVALVVANVGPSAKLRVKGLPKGTLVRSVSEMRTYDPIDLDPEVIDLPAHSVLHFATK